MIVRKAVIILGMWACPSEQLRYLRAMLNCYAVCLAGSHVVGPA